MKSNTILWLIIFALGVTGLVFAGINKAGVTWVKDVPHEYVGMPADLAAEVALKQMEQVPQGVLTKMLPRDERTFEPGLSQEALREKTITKIMGMQSATGVWAKKGSEQAEDLQTKLHDLDPDATLTEIDWTERIGVPRNNASEANGDRVSGNRTIGIWLAAIFTLAIMSFLVGDNPLYKTAESVVIGASAAYWMVYSFYTGIVDKLLAGLLPGAARDWAVPGLAADQSWEWIYLIPAMLSIMLLWRLAPVGGWISRWPLAFVIGATAGFRMLGFLESDFIIQIKHTILNLWYVYPDGTWDMWTSVAAWVVLVGVLACLTYFFFSVEHKGAIGKTARLGIYFLMVAFGSAFAFTVMGRITLLTERFGFLFRDWLNVLN